MEGKLINPCNYTRDYTSRKAHKMANVGVAVGTAEGRKGTGTCRVCVSRTVTDCHGVGPRCSSVVRFNILMSTSLTILLHEGGGKGEG